MTDSDLEILEEYVLGRLAALQNAEVEQKLQSDSEWMLAYQKILILKETAQRHQLREQIGQIQNRKLAEWITPASSSKSKMLKWPAYIGTGIAAGIACLLYLNFASVNLPPELNLNERGKEAIMQPDDLQNIRLFKEGQYLMKAQKYDLAQQTFKEIENNNTISKYYRDMARWMRVVAYSKFDEEEARNLLKKIESEADYSFQIPFFDLLKIKTRLLY